MKHCLIILLSIISSALQAQNYISYFTGNTVDATSNPKGGACLMGGASEDDNAMKWFLQQADGGDILVLRASGSDGYNDYLFSQLGIPVNSVETIVCLNPLSGSDPYIVEKISKAEGIWFAGGDQWNYISYWRNTPMNVALNQAIERNCVLGGTSAGMAILGGIYFSAENGTVTSATTLNDPYSASVTVSNIPFLALPYLTQVITDTHYDNPDRRGRHVGFMARNTAETQNTTYGIACDEYVAICIDTLGMASIFGEYPAYDDYAYFVLPNCEVENNFPENCAAGFPLTWNQNNQALKAFKAYGTIGGTSSFNLNNWMEGTGGLWQDWWVDNGVLNEQSSDSPQCFSSLESNGPSFLIENPALLGQWIHCPETVSPLKVITLQGEEVEIERKSDYFKLKTEVAGSYYVHTHNKVIKLILIE